MTSKHEKNMAIVQGLTTININTDALAKTNVANLAKKLIENTKTVKQAAKDLDTARQKEQDSLFIEKIFNTHTDNVKNAHLDLNQALSLLAEDQSKLLLFNTAIAHVLYQQSLMLNAQQKKLIDQANQLQKQQNTIEDLQQKLSENGEKIIENQTNIANIVNKRSLETTQFERLVTLIKEVEKMHTKILHMFDN